MPISISSEVLGTLSVTIAETTGTLEVGVLATAPAILSVELGTPGPAATVTVGSTTTLSAGSSATVTNSGTNLAAVFNFGIPQGPQGTQGQTGATGATGATGQGVATGGTTGQLLTKASGTNYDTTWTTVIPGDRYLTTSTTSLTINNADKTLTIGTGLSYSPQQDVTISETSSPTTRHMHARVTTYDSVTGVMVVNVISHSGTGTYSSWVVNVGGVTPATSVAWGAITGTVSDQTDLQTALDAKYDASNPAGYATESWVSSQGYLTSAPNPSADFMMANAIASLIYSQGMASSGDLVVGNPPLFMVNLSTNWGIVDSTSTYYYCNGFSGNSYGLSGTLSSGPYTVRVNGTDSAFTI